MDPAPTIEPSDPRRFTVEQYFALVDRGVLGEDDRVELLEGVVVAMPPRGPEHATAVSLVYFALTGSREGDPARMTADLSLARLATGRPRLVHGG